MCSIKCRKITFANFTVTNFFLHNTFWRVHITYSTVQSLQTFHFRHVLKMCNIGHYSYKNLAVNN